MQFSMGREPLKISVGRGALVVISGRRGGAYNKTLSEECASPESQVCRPLWALKIIVREGEW